MGNIMLITETSLPKAKFLFNLIKYCYPRRYRTFINLHSDNLIQWSSKDTYLRNLRELEEKGIIKRYYSYKVDKFSKSIKTSWQFKDTGNAILVDNRAPEEEDFEDTIKASYKP
ncbi:MAG: hypothetical protein PHG41_05565 [Actinomycetota bacterium]|nr:hypothetical protein [Actinomycetota bacterium]